MKREPAGTRNLRELIEQAELPVTIGDEHGPWYEVRSSRPSVGKSEAVGGKSHATHVDLEVQFPDGGIGERLEVPVDQDVEVYE